MSNEPMVLILSDGRNILLLGAYEGVLGVETPKPPELPTIEFDAEAVELSVEPSKKKSSVNVPAFLQPLPTQSKKEKPWQNKWDKM